LKAAVIVSLKDPAGLNIRDSLLELFDFEKKDSYYVVGDISLYSVQQESINAEDIDDRIDADFFVFATKHQSSSGIRSLCVHAPGNWSKAELGGKSRQLCIAPCLYLKKALQLLDRSAGEFEVVQECTHHGPFIKKPCMFIEIGSNEEQWQNKEAGNAIAKTSKATTAWNITAL